jgi:hypothetical protein
MGISCHAPFYSTIRENIDISFSLDGQDGGTFVFRRPFLIHGNSIHFCPEKIHVIASEAKRRSNPERNNPVIASEAKQSTL